MLECFSFPAKQSIYFTHSLLDAVSRLFPILVTLSYLSVSLLILCHRRTSKVNRVGLIQLVSNIVHLSL